jgi:radical SAM superfamily enzyme YgiQ (UPF0313 family)
MLCYEQDTGAETDSVAVRESTARIQEERRQRIAGLRRHEQDWRWFAGDGQDPSVVSDRASARELALDLEARRRLAGTLGLHDPATLCEERLRLKHFPVLLVSAPHIEEAVSGTFPGSPTPLQFATVLLDRALQIDEFPGARVPEVVAVMNPPLYSDEFVSELSHLVRTKQPRVVGISNLSEGHYYSLQIARIVKAISPETIVLLGGQHEDGTNPIVYRRTAARAEQARVPRNESRRLDGEPLGRLTSCHTLETTQGRELVDFVAAGDCPHLLMEFLVLVADNLDLSLIEFKRVIASHADRFAVLPGSSFLFYIDENERLAHIETSGRPIDGNELPFISVERLTHENRFPVFDHKLTAQVMACLGCKYSCAFCHESADHLLYSRPKLLQRRVEHVMKELDLRFEQGFEAVFFDDSTFTQNRRWLDGLLDAMLAHRHSQGWLEWGCQTTVIDLDANLVTRMADAGCTYIYIGVESVRPQAQVVQKARRAQRTGETWATLLQRVAGWCSQAGIRVGTSLQFGLGETPEDRAETLELIARLYEQGAIAQGCVALNINAPYPGTDQWIQLSRSSSGPLPDYAQRLVRHPAFETAHQYTALHPDELDDIYAEARAVLGDAILMVDFEAHQRWRLDGRALHAS